MARELPAHMNRRERQIMDTIYRLGEATAAETQAELTDDPSYSAVRAALRLLETKGLLKHRYDGPRYIYTPAISRNRARRAVLGHLVETFFRDAEEQVVSTLLKVSNLSPDKLDRIAKLIEEAKRNEAKK